MGNSKTLWDEVVLAVLPALIQTMSESEDWGHEDILDLAFLYADTFIEERNRV